MQQAVTLFKILNQIQERNTHNLLSIHQETTKFYVMLTLGRLTSTANDLTLLMVKSILATIGSLKTIFYLLKLLRFTV